MPSSAPSLRRLVESRLFTGLEDAALKQILCAAQVCRIASKKAVTAKGGRPDYLFLLRSGRAKFYIPTESGSEVLLSWVVPSDVIGLVSLLANPPDYLASSATVADCEFLSWNHGNIRRLAKAYPQLAENGFRLALHYLGVYIKRHASVMTKNAETRLAQTLLQLATEVGEMQPLGVAIDITNEQLGSLSDMSSFTASRLLSKWEREGTLSKHRGRVMLHAPESLMIAHGQQAD